MTHNGYQPKLPKLDVTNPPQGGSGVPPKELGEKEEKEMEKTDLSVDVLVKYVISLLEDSISQAGNNFLPGTAISVSCVLPWDYFNDCYHNGINTKDLEEEVARRAGEEIAKKGYEVYIAGFEVPVTGWIYGTKGKSHPSIGLKVYKPMIKLGTEGPKGGISEEDMPPPLPFQGAGKGMKKK